jgi:hypothetical protein
MSDAQRRQITQKIGQLTQLHQMGMLTGEELFDAKSRLSDGLPKEMVGDAVLANKATKRRVGSYDYYEDVKKSNRLFRTVVSRFLPCGQAIYVRIYLLDEEQALQDRQPVQYRQQVQDRQQVQYRQQVPDRQQVQYRQQVPDRKQRQDQLQRKWEDEEHELRCRFEKEFEAMQKRQHNEGRVF